MSLGEDSIASKCICGKGYVRDCPDKDSEIPVYFDCDVCEEFYTITKDGSTITNTVKFNVGDRFLCKTLDHLSMFVYINELGLSFYDYEVQQYEDKMYGLIIKGIAKE